MWYPIDNVRSSQAGEAPVSALPDLYYCSQADLDIDIVMHIKPAAYYTAWIIYGNGAHYPNSAGAPWTSECSKDCNGTAEADADAWGFDIGPYCTYQPDYYHCICTVSDNQNLIIPTVKHDEWIYGIEGTAQKCGQAYGNHTYDSWLWPRLVEGWYRYMGNYKDFKSIKDQSNIEILDYSMNSSDCDTAGGEWHEGASTILGSSWYTSDGNGVPGKVSDFDNNVDKIMSGRSGCLLPVSKYKLKCSYTKADKLWVNRIKYPMNDNPFGSTDPYYKFASSTFWGGQMVPPADNNLVGPIYGCNSKNYDALGNSYCQYLKYSDNGAYLSLDSNHQANDNLYGNNSTWANQNAMTNNLNLFWNLDRSPNDTNGYSKNPSIECGGSNSRPASACFVKPTITPIQIFNSQGKLVTSNPPTLTGVYTITFGVSVDKEQAPIKKLDINLRDGQHIVWTNIDSASKLTFIHRYDSVPADINKKVTVDVVDGWDVETCSAGVPAGCQ